LSTLESEAAGVTTLGQAERTSPELQPIGSGAPSTPPVRKRPQRRWWRLVSPPVLLVIWQLSQALKIISVEKLSHHKHAPYLKSQLNGLTFLTCRATLRVYECT
jgi:hypothetical protein